LCAANNQPLAGIFIFEEPLKELDDIKSSAKFHIPKAYYRLCYHDIGCGQLQVEVSVCVCVPNSLDVFNNIIYVTFRILLLWWGWVVLSYIPITDYTVNVNVDA